MNIKELVTFCHSLKIIQGDKHSIECLSDLKASRPRSLVFVKNKKFLDTLERQLSSDLELSAVFDEKLWERTLNQEIFKHQLKAILVTNEVDISMSLLSKPFYDQVQQKKREGSKSIDSSVQISSNCFIGERVTLAEGVVIHPGVTLMGDCKIGKNSILYPNVTIYENVEIGKYARIHSGTVIGADGFGYNYKEGTHHKVWHMGGVTIGDHFEIGANSCVDQGTFSPTIIGDGVKLDNQTQVGHNAIVGSGVILCGHAGLAGSTIIGDYTVLGGYVAIGPGIELGEGCQVGGGGKVLNNWPAGTQLGGHPARPLKEWLRGLAWLRKESQKK